MTQSPSPAASPLKNLEKGEWDISMKWNAADLPTIKRFTLSATTSTRDPMRYPAVANCTPARRPRGSMIFCAKRLPMRPPPMNIEVT